MSDPSDPGPAVPSDPDPVTPGRPDSVAGEPAPVTGVSDADALTEQLVAAGMLTLTGPAGIGKSRLATRLARTAGLPVHRVDLSACQDSARVPQAVAEALGVAPGTGGDPLPGLLRLLSRQEGLLVLDTCEHVRTGCAYLVGRLHDACPRLRILATSRRPLTVPGELLVRVGPLNLEQGARLLQEHAAGQGVPLPNPSAVLLAQRLDGDPLSSLLAARALRRMDLSELFLHLSAPGGHLAVLTGGPVEPARHRTLLRAVEWSHRLCNRRQQLLWARLSGFSGEFTRDHVQVLFTGSGELDALVDASIVLPVGEARFRLPVAHRGYGQLRLVDLAGSRGTDLDT
ncbi:AAA family ATPase [Streptomyces sp. NPDC050704]|uniref:ATP-binding protein n=1 Tax=Streptomyces sp. NPDC050704 TaxID=3157219 RepID=UPI0034298183